MHRHLVILRADHLGDMILTTPLARTMAAAGWKVTAVGAKAWAPVWENNPHASYCGLETICGGPKLDVWALAGWLRKLAPTHILTPYHHPQLFWASALSGVRKRYCQMGRYWGRLTLHHCLRTGILEEQRHMGEVWQDFAEAVGVARTSPQPELFVSPTEKTKMGALLAEKLPGDLPLVIVHPFHGGSSCHLSLGAYASITRHLQESGRCRLVITGLARERELWLGAANDLATKNYWISCGELSLRELIALVQQAQRVICGSTGILHIASGLNVPTTSAMCPHPLVSPNLWKNLEPGAVMLSPELKFCEQERAQGVTNCGFCHGPTPQEVAESVLNSIS